MSDTTAAQQAILNYTQADMDGIMVLTSRQAIHEVCDELDRLRAVNAALLEALGTIDAILTEAGRSMGRTEVSPASPMAMARAAIAAAPMAMARAAIAAAKGSDQ